MRYLHTMLRVRNLDAALDFYVQQARPARRSAAGSTRRTSTRWCSWRRPRTSAVVEDAQEDGPRRRPMVELTYNWDTEDYGEARYFGHLAYEVDDIYATCEQLMKARRHHQPAAARRQHGLRALARQAFDRAAAEGQAAKPPQEPWTSMPNTGKW